MKRHRLAMILVLGLVVTMSALIGYKISALDYSLNKVIPETSYVVDVMMTFEGFGEPVSVSTYLPRNESGHQMIVSELTEAVGLQNVRKQHDEVLKSRWRTGNVKGNFSVRYHFEALVKPFAYHIEPSLRIPVSYSESLSHYLGRSDSIQVDDPFIAAMAKQLRHRDHLIEPTLKNIYKVVSALKPKRFKGLTDAVTAARLGAASCNGKSRLFVALARYLNIPARLVGGLILTHGTKKTSHQWLEVYIGGHWVPFDALNGHYASLPNNYLVLYRGDRFLFKHSKNINFKYGFKISKRLVPNRELTVFLGKSNLNIYGFLTNFQRVNISLNLLRIILMMPIGVLFVVIGRNVIGLSTFGTFLPALMAVASRDTGLIAGLIAFALVIFVTSLIRYPLDKLGILHTPKLAILMVVVVVTILSLGIVSQEFEIGTLSSIGAAGLFPIAILTITSERFALSVTEEGLAKTLSRLVQTLFVMSASYAAMDSLALQAIVLSFPEVMLGVVALNIWLGTWTGLRISELFRYRSIIFGTTSDKAIG
jgi:hypothetical protein